MKLYPPSPQPAMKRDLRAPRSLSPRPKNRLRAVLALAAACAVLAACQTTPTSRPLATADRVDLDRYMGDWYVIASIPTWPEKNAYDAVESYRRRDDGRIATTFTFRDGSADAPIKTMNPLGRVIDRQSNAIWTMQFIWPFEADYRIMRIDPGYHVVVVGREKRDYVWIMARTPTLPDAEYRRLVDFVGDQGYDLSKLRRVPQRPLDQRAKS